MGTYINIRGWLECDTTQLALIRQFVNADPHDYNGGWAFPTSQINWHCYAYYGANIRTSATDWFLDQLRRIAALPATDDDNERVCGLFLASHEDNSMSEWQIRDGDVLTTPADTRYHYLDI